MGILFLMLLLVYNFLAILMHFLVIAKRFSSIWIPAFAGMTVEEAGMTGHHDTKLPVIPLLDRGIQIKQLTAKLPVVARNVVTKQSRDNVQTVLDTVVKPRYDAPTTQLRHH